MASTQDQITEKPRLSWHTKPPEPKVVGRLGPWQLVELLGEGAMTRVYLARPHDSPHAEPAYAVKVLRKPWWSEPLAIAMLRREAEVGRAVTHANVLPVLDAEVNQPPYFLATPRIAGQSVRAMLDSAQPVSLPAALWIARQTAKALAALHRADWLHCDVKPSNLMMAPDGHVTLIDLGFCQTPAGTRSWTDRPVMGTLNYIAPEMVTSSCAASGASDLYSLGATLYEMIAGRPPLVADDPAALVAMHREVKPECLRSMAPDVPKGVASLVHRLLAKEPLRRPESASAVAEELVRLEIGCLSHAA